MSDLDDQAGDVLRHYPRIYLACHSNHKNRKGQGPEISARDQSILVHVPRGGVLFQTLRTHLDVAPSTLSAALKRLAMMKLLTLSPDPKDARGKVVRLTASGRAAQLKTSVLDIALVRAALARVGLAERAAIVRGLELLADAAGRRDGK